jgi:hypothetical protein
MLVAPPSSTTDFRLQGNVGPCALILHVEWGRVFVVDLAQTSIQFLLQAMQLETELHLSTVGAHCFEVWVKYCVNFYREFVFGHVPLLTSGFLTSLPHLLFFNIIPSLGIKIAPRDTFCTYRKHALPGACILHHFL